MEDWERLGLHFLQCGEAVLCCKYFLLTDTLKAPRPLQTKLWISQREEGSWHWCVPAAGNVISTVQWPKAFWDPVAACGVCRLISNNIWDSLSPASVVKECKQLFINKCEVETTAPAKGSESIWKVWKKKMQRKNDEH